MKVDVVRYEQKVIDDAGVDSVDNPDGYSAPEEMGTLKRKRRTYNSRDSTIPLKQALELEGNYDKFQKLSHFSIYARANLDELNEAAIKLQKVYKSYRTRRNLADCAVIIEELWWKVSNFTKLKQSSISYYDTEKQESAVSRWARASTRAAKVGKGLSKNEKAQKLALRHWLEAIDPCHRYGHNLQFYYNVWLANESSQPFFYWLDVGHGKELNLKRCPRTVLKNQRVKYLGPKERKDYEVIINHGKILYEQSRMPVNTAEGSKWIFVLSTTRNLYIGEKKKGLFQHSSFLAGAATSASGRLVAHNGVLKAIWPYSGHYHPTEENFLEFINFLREHHVDLANVKRCSIDEDFPARPINMKQIETEPMQDHSSKPREEALDGEGKLPSPSSLEFGKPKAYKQWSTGAGPRIRCVREYPTDLRSQALEQVKLSPRLPNNASTSCLTTGGGPIPSPRPSPRVRLSAS